MKTYKFIIYAPYVNSGGGKTLLLQLIYQFKNYKNSLLVIDPRVNFSLTNTNFDTRYCKNGIFSFLLTEIYIYVHSDSATKLICMHGAPPLIKNLGYVVVFFQNRLHLNYKNSFFNLYKNLKNYFFTKSFHFCDEIIVQNDSMLYEMKVFFKKNRIDKMLTKKPFFDKFYLKQRSINQKKYDFVYIADASVHKNHKNLILAWILLAEENIRPSLLLTIPNSQYDKINSIKKISKKYNLNLCNTYISEPSKISDLYLSSRALIYPSLSESFGLPLIEAKIFNLPILASELDFVRDVCSPVFSFDPNSPLSISNAVKRYLKIPFTTQKILSSKSFLKSVFSEDS